MTLHSQYDREIFRLALPALGALAAEGTSSIRGAHHVRRGYENIERKFLDLGARIERVLEAEPLTPS